MGGAGKLLSLFQQQAFLKTVARAPHHQDVIEILLKFMELSSMPSMNAYCARVH